MDEVDGEGDFKNWGKEGIKKLWGMVENDGDVEQVQQKGSGKLGFWMT